MPLTNVQELSECLPETLGFHFRCHFRCFRFACSVTSSPDDVVKSQCVLTQFGSARLGLSLEWPLVNVGPNCQATLDAQKIDKFPKVGKAFLAASGRVAVQKFSRVCKPLGPPLRMKLVLGCI